MSQTEPQGHEPPPQDRPMGLYVLSICLGLTKPAQRQWLKDEAMAGRIPCLMIGQTMMFNRAAVERALVERAAVAYVREPGATS